MLGFLKRLFGHPSAPEIYTYHQGRIFTNGAQEYAFGINKELPLYSPIGPGTAVQRYWMLDQPPQVWNPQSIPIAGIGGLQAGSMVTQPLLNQDYTPVE